MLIPVSIITFALALSLMTAPAMAIVLPPPPTKLFAWGSFIPDDVPWICGDQSGHRCFFFLMVGSFEGDGDPPGSHSGDPCSGFGMFCDMTAGKMWILKVTYWKWGWSDAVPDDILVGGTAMALDGFSYMGSIRFELRLYKCESTCINFMDVPDESFLYWNEPSGNGHIAFWS